MIGKVSQNLITPSTLGTSTTSSVYGSVIPCIFGRTKSQLYLIWMANIRQVPGIGKKGKGSIGGGGGGKGKKGKGSAPQFAANVDMLLGHNPIVGVLQFWYNTNTKLPLNFLNTNPMSPSGSVVTVDDVQFYSVLGVTATGTYSFNINDYGGPGPQTLAGAWEIPCWNTAFAGPDPTNPSPYRYFPYCVYWTPAMGNTVRIEQGAVDTDYKVYYAQLWPTGASAYSKKNTDTSVPSGALDLTFESVLGSGPEFAGWNTVTNQPLLQQQILYPMYAGLGSPELQMGSSTAIPDIRPEVQGSYGMYATGDAEFPDMLEDIVKQGLQQAGNAVEYEGNPTPAFTTLQRGIGAFDFPGPIQKKFVLAVERNAMQGAVYYDLPNTAGNFLVVAGTCGTGGIDGGGSPYSPTLSISDTAGNSWTAALPEGLGVQVWWAKAVYAAANSVRVTNLGYNASVLLMELAGVDTFDVSAVGSGGSSTAGNSATVTASNATGNPEYLLAFSLSYSLIDCTDPQNPLWNTLISGTSQIFNTAFGYPNAINHLILQARTVYNPGNYTFTQQPPPLADATAPPLCLLAFKNSQPSSYPKSLGNLLDETTMNVVRLQCRAFGLYGSWKIDSQSKASDLMGTLLQAMNAAPVWSGFALKVIARSEQSYAGNGALFTAPTAAGPLVQLRESDFIVGDGESMIVTERTARTDIPNIKQIQFPNRGSDYYPVVISQPETGSIALFGPRKDSPQQMDMIQDPAIGRAILSVLVNDQNYVVNTYKFTLKKIWDLLDPMDLITIPDPDSKLNVDTGGNNISIAVQLTKIEENDKMELECEAVPFIYGCHAPLPLAVTPTSATSSLQAGQEPGTINPPIIFEPVPRLYGQANQGEIWTVTSAAFVPQPGSAPTGTAGTGGSLVAGTYYCSVTYVNAAGAESLPSQESSGVGVAANGKLIVTSPAANPYASFYNVYIGEPNAVGGAMLQNLSPIAIGTNYTQTGAIADGVTVPTNSFAGCTVYLSTNGGSSYTVLGQAAGSAATGTSTADWPASVDPDTTNNLALDLTESAGTLTSYAVTDEDNFVYPCYVAGGGTNFIPYELMTYAVATLTSSYHYTLEATGGNHLRRAVFGAPEPGAGVDHPSGSRFALLSAASTGIYKLTMDPRWTSGQTLYFKFLPYNSFGGGSPSLADVPAWPFTPKGVAAQQNPNANTYTNTPATSLSRTSTTVVAMVQVAVQFTSNLVNYNARTFSIPVPVANTVYYVTIADPGFVGDTGTATNLTATIQTSNALVGVPGNTYMGFIQVSPIGIADDTAGPGGIPIPFTVVVGQ